MLCVLVCVCGEVGSAGRWGHSPTSIYLKLRGSFFFFFLHPVAISYSRCQSVCHILVCHTETTMEWAVWMNKQQCECKHSARERGSYSLPKANIFFSYSRVRFSESYLGIILIPTQFLPPKANNSGYHFGQLIKCTAKVWSCLLEHKKPTVADSRYST